MNMNYLNLLKEWIEKSGTFSHSHDGWPTHNVAVKLHAQYFASHPWLLHPATAEKPTLPAEPKPGVVPQTVSGEDFDPDAPLNFYDLPVGTMISATNNYGKLVSGKITNIFFDQKGNKKYSVSGASGKFNLYPSEFSKKTSGYYGLKDIEVAQQGSEEETKHHEAHVDTDFSKLPKGTHVKLDYSSTGTTLNGTITGQLSTGTYTVLLGEGGVSTVAPHELEQGFFGGGDATVKVHVIDEPKELPKKEEKIHPLNPGDKVGSIKNISPGDILDSGQNEYEFLGTVGDFASIKHVESGHVYSKGTTIENLEKDYSFVSSHKDKLSPKKLVPGMQLSANEINDLHLGDVLKHIAGGGKYSIHSIDPKTDSWKLEQDGQVFEEKFSGKPSLSLQEYSFQHHGNHEEKNHPIPQEKLKNLQPGDKVKSKLSGHTYTLTSSVDPNGKAFVVSHETGASLPDMEVTSEAFELVSQAPKHDVHNLPTGSMITYDNPGYDKPLTAKILDGDGTKGYTVDIFDGNGALIADHFGTLPGEVMPGSLFGYKISDITVPEKQEKIVPGMHLSDIGSGLQDQLVGAQVKTTGGGSGIIVDQNDTHFFVEWQNAPGITYSYDKEQAKTDWTIDQIHSVEKISSEQSNYGTGEIQFKGLNLGQAQAVQQIDLKTFYKVNMAGTSLWISEEELKNAKASLITPAVKPDISPLTGGAGITSDNYHQLEPGNIVYVPTLGVFAKIVSNKGGAVIGEDQNGNTIDVPLNEGAFYSHSQILPGAQLSTDIFPFLPVGTVVGFPTGDQDEVISVTTSGVSFADAGFVQASNLESLEATIEEVPGQAPKEAQVAEALQKLGIVPQKTASNLEVGDKLMFDDGSYYQISSPLYNGKYQVTVHTKAGTQTDNDSFTIENIQEKLKPGTFQLTIIPKTETPKWDSLKVGDKFKFNFGSKELEITHISETGNYHVVHPDGTKDIWHPLSLQDWFKKNKVEYLPKSGLSKIDYSKLKVGDTYVHTKTGKTWKIMSSLGSDDHYSVEDSNGVLGSASPNSIEEWTSGDSGNVTSSNAVSKPKKQSKISMIDAHNLEKGTKFKMGDSDEEWKIIKTWKLKHGGFNYTAQNMISGYQNKYSSTDFEYMLHGGAFHSVKPVGKPGYAPKQYIDWKDFEINVGDKFILPNMGQTMEVTGIKDDGSPKFIKTYSDGSSGSAVIDWYTKKSVLQQLNKGLWKISDESASAPAAAKTIFNLEAGDKFKLQDEEYTVISIDSDGKYKLSSPKFGDLTTAYSPEYINKHYPNHQILSSSSSESIKQQPVSTYSPPDIHGEVHETVNWDERLEKIGGKMGYNEGGKFKDKVSGTEFYVKFPQSFEHAEVEQLATNLYRLASVKVAQADLIDFQGQKAIKVHWLPNSKDLSPAEAGQKGEALRKHFAIDAWLANWDVAGGYNSNNIVESNGELYRIDPGGAFHFKGSGGIKPFGPEVKELDSMKNASTAPMASKIFASTTAEELKFGADILMGITDKHIQDAVNDTGLPTHKKNELASTLISRRNDVVQKVLGYQYDPTTKGYKHAPKPVPSYQKKPTVQQVQKTVYEMGSATKVSVFDRIKNRGNEKHNKLLEAAMAFDWSGNRSEVNEKLNVFGDANGIQVSTFRNFASGWQGSGSVPQIKMRGALNELLGLWDEHESLEQTFFTREKKGDLVPDKIFKANYETGKLHAHEAIPYIAASQNFLQKKYGEMVQVWRGIMGPDVTQWVKNAHKDAQGEDRIAMPGDGASGWSLNLSTARGRAHGGVLFKKTLPIRDFLVMFNVWSGTYTDEEEVIAQSLATKFFSKDEISFPPS